MNLPTMAPMLAELEQEEAATLRMLERVPGDKLDWRPHPKSMTLGQLALHTAGTVGDVSNFLELEGFDVNDADFEAAQPASIDEILEKFETAQATARERFAALSEDQAAAPWTLSKGEEEIWTIPKAWLARSLMMNHLYHHRGQLSVYLRLLDVPVPVTYGRSADEDAF
jgi:uncharacterized damage-inducible protein DinB